jgi:hypothetical protein
MITDDEDGEEQPDVEDEEQPDVEDEEQPDVEDEEQPDVEDEEQPDVDDEEQWRQESESWSTEHLRSKVCAAIAFSAWWAHRLTRAWPLLS